MIQIRRDVFETNSSSTHSLTMCMEDEFNNWKNSGNLYLNKSDFLSDSEYDDKIFVTLNEILDILKLSPLHEVYSDLSAAIEANDSRRIDDILHNENFQTYDDFMEYEEYMDIFEQHYTTPNGDKVVGFGFYGYD